MQTRTICAVVGGVEMSAIRSYWKDALTSTSLLSGSMVRTSRGGEELSKVFCLIMSSRGHHRSNYSIICDSSLQSGKVGLWSGRRGWRTLPGEVRGQLEGAQEGPRPHDGVRLCSLSTRSIRHMCPLSSH